MTTFIFLLLFLIGLSLGSFFNVVIHRLPKMIYYKWITHCEQCLKETSTKQEFIHFKDKPYHLLLPPSHCPHCQRTLKIYHNVPLLSFIFLKKRCYFCHKPISWRYPLVELSTALLFIFCYSLTGLTEQLPALLLFISLILPLCIIDFQEQLLPDPLTYLLLWSGLLVSCFSIFIDPASAILGAIGGYSLFWLTAQLFKKIKGQEGLGYGDCKLLAALGAWVGWQGLLWIVLFASLSGTLVTLILIIFKRCKANQPIPFGPFLGVSGWLTLINLHKIQGWIQ